MKRTLLNFLKSFRSLDSVAGNWGERTPLRPSTIILQGWQLSVGCRVSHRGTVFCRRILTDVSRWFCVRCCATCPLFLWGSMSVLSLPDLMFICWWSITLSTVWGLVLPFPTAQSLCLHYEGQVINRYTGISYCTKLLNVDAENLKAPCQNISPSF